AAVVVRGQARGRGDARGQAARQRSREGRGPAAEGVERIGVQRHLDRHGPEPLPLQPARLAGRVDAGAKRPRQRAVAGGGGAGDHLPGRGRPRIPRRPRWQPVEPPPHEPEELLPLVPPATGDHALRGDAVERRIVGDRRGHGVGLGAQLWQRIAARHHDPGRDVAQFAGDRFVEDGTSAGGTGSAAAPDECVEGPLPAREVHV
ncbi:MAG: hypothetical protein ACK56I_25540, partial [bacterium]